MITHETTLMSVASILIRTFAIAIAILLLWLIGYLSLGEIWYDVQSRLFQFSYHEFRLIHYGGLLLMKTIAVCFLFCPYVGIRWFLYQKRSANRSS